MEVLVTNKLNLFSTNKFEFKEGLNIIVGENGSGKSTLCKEITEFLNKNNIKFIKYDAYSESGCYSASNALLTGNYKESNILWNKSEGETGIFNLGNFVSKINKTIKAIDNYEKLFIILDAIDSGLSINRIVEIRELFDIIINDINEMNLSKNIHKEIYIVASSNTFELVQNARCIYVKNGKIKKFGTYSSFRNFILKCVE